MKIKTNVFSLLILFSLLSSPAFGQQKIDPAPFSPLVLAQAQTMIDNLINLNFKKATPYIHPDLFEYFWNEKQLEEFYEMIKEETLDNGLVLEVVFNSPIVMVKDSNEYYCLMDFRANFHYKIGTEWIDGKAIARSADYGKTWKFIPIDTEGFRIEEYVEKMRRLGIEIAWSK